MDDLELYPKINPVRTFRDGLRTMRANWKAIAAYLVVVMLVFGYAGYRWMTTSTAVDQSRAIQLFRAERSDDVAAASTGAGSSSTSKKAGSHKTRSSGHRATKVSRGGSTPVVAGSRTSASPGSGTATAKNEDGFSLPEEGVYSWDTDGYEQVGGARREFPKETQRVITWNSQTTWTVHHYFSEEREIWTDFSWGSRGADITKQRNKVTFGPVTNDSSIDFNPAMLVGPKNLKVGYEWGGEWSGDTHGDYQSKIIEHTTMSIGGEQVEVWGMSYVINLHGKQEGRVEAEVWLAPEEGITVQEHYVQDVDSSGASYHAEWTQKLRSMHPER
jgi:hypothetical protein